MEGIMTIYWRQAAVELALVVWGGLLILFPQHGPLLFPIGIIAVAVLVVAIRPKRGV
jgi:hypothetical protein